jgi:ankyrin repeat protein
MAVQICIDHGTYLGYAGIHQETPLHLAAGNGHRGVVQLFMGAGADCEAKDDERRTALMMAAKAGHGAVVEVLLHCGAEVGTKDKHGSSALHLAARLGHDHVVRILSDRGAPLDDALALWLAASQGIEADVRSLLDRGVPVDIMMDNGPTALYCAALGGHSDVVRLLIDRGANIEAIANASDFARGKTIMHVITSRFGTHERFGQVVQLCCNAGADVNAVDHTGCTPLLLAVKNTGLWYYVCGGARGPLQALLDHGANIDAEDEDGLTALHHAARERLDTAVIAVLLAHRAQINTRDRRGRTSLHLAARYNSRLKLDVTQLLLDHGAEINDRDSHGMTPLDHAPRANVGCTTSEMLIGLGAVEGCSIGALDAGFTDSRLGRS